MYPLPAFRVWYVYIYIYQDPLPRHKKKNTFPTSNLYTPQTILGAPLLWHAPKHDTSIYRNFATISIHRNFDVSIYRTFRYDIQHQSPNLQVPALVFESGRDTRDIEIAGSRFRHFDTKFVGISMLPYRNFSIYRYSGFFDTIANTIDNHLTSKSGWWFARVVGTQHGQSPQFGRVCSVAFVNSK